MAEKEKKKPRRPANPLSKRPLRTTSLQSIERSTLQKHVVTPNSKELVRRLVVVGMSKVQIAQILGVSQDTINKHYKQEMTLSAASATAKVAQALFDNAMSGNVAAQIFWMKTRGGWSEKRWVELTGKEGGPIEFSWAGEVIDAVIDETAEDQE